MKEKLYTVKDVAAIIAHDPDPASVNKIIRQVRHWTNNDLLFTLGGKDTGTGVSRVYDADGVRLAAILLDLTRYGITVDMLEGIDEWISDRAESDEWAAAVEGREDYFLQFAWEPGEDKGGTWFPGLDGGLLCRKEFLKKSGFNIASVIVVNVTAIFQRLVL